MAKRSIFWRVVGVEKDRCVSYGLKCACRANFGSLTRAAEKETRSVARDRLLFQPPGLRG